MVQKLPTFFDYLGLLPPSPDLPEFCPEVLQRMIDLAGSHADSQVYRPVYWLPESRIGVAKFFSENYLDFAGVFAVTHASIAADRWATALPEIQEACCLAGLPFLPGCFLVDPDPAPNSLTGRVTVDHSSPAVDLSITDYLASLPRKRRYKCKTAAAYYKERGFVFERLTELDLDWAVRQLEHRWYGCVNSTSSAVLQLTYAAALVERGRAHWFACKDPDGRPVAITGIIERPYGHLYQSFVGDTRRMYGGELPDVGLATLHHAALDMIARKSVGVFNVTGFTEWDNPDFNVYKYAVCNAEIPVRTIAVASSEDDSLHSPYYFKGEVK
jgi:hypothetical protein